MTGKLPRAIGYQDLIVDQKANDLAIMVFRLSNSFPKEEIYSLTNQIRRSSRSAGAQIAVAWGKRQYLKHFISKLTDAISEVYETEHWLIVALKCGYLSEDTCRQVLIKCDELCRMITGMINKADQFCNHPKHSINR